MKFFIKWIKNYYTYKVGQKLAVFIKRDFYVLQVITLMVFGKYFATTKLFFHYG